MKCMTLLTLTLKIYLNLHIKFVNKIIHKQYH